MRYKGTTFLLYIQQSEQKNTKKQRETSQPLVVIKPKP